MTGAAQGELLERDSECSLIDSVLDRALRGEGRRLVIEGPAGIGKSTLLAIAVEKARERGIEPRGCVCSEPGAHIALSAARELLADVVPAVSLDSNIALSAVSLAQTTLELATESPLMIVVDDAQWADEASLHFLALVARRITSARIVLAIAVRSEAAIARDGALGELLDDRRAVVLRPAPLSLAATAEVIRASLGDGTVEALVRAAHRQTAGNPYLVSVLRDALRQTNGDAGLDPETLVAEAGARQASRLIARQFDELQPQARPLLEAAAVLGELGTPAELAGIVGADPVAFADAARRLAARGLLVSAEGTRLTHPLLAAAIRTSIGARRRIELLRAAAEGLVREGRTEEAAARLAELPPRGDPGTAQTLAAAAQLAIARGAPELGAQLLERALAEPPVAERRAELRAQLGEALLAVGNTGAANVLECALAELSDSVARAAAARALALALTYQLQIKRAADTLVEVASELGAGHPALAEELEAAALHYESLDSSLRERRLAQLRSRGDRRGSSELAYRMRLVELACEAHGGARPVAEPTALLERALAGGTLLTGAPETHFKAVVVLAQLRRGVLARAQLGDAIALAAERGETARMCYALGLQGQLTLMEGNVLAAEAEVRAALELVDYRERGSPFLLGPLIEALVEKDEAEMALRELRRAGLAGELPAVVSQAAILYARGLAHHANGALELALEDLELAGESLTRFGTDTPAAVPWRSAAAQVLVELDRREEGHVRSAEEVALAEQIGIPEVLGRACRVHATTATRGRHNLLVRAVDLLAGGSARLEYARALSDLAALEADDGQLSEARERLRRAQTIAEQLGANKLAQQARARLTRAGGRPRRAAIYGVGALTPTELKVATLARQGMTNPEIARTLVLATKTIEGHLANTYRKLGIDNRAQLAGAIVPSGEPVHRADPTGS